MRNSKAFGKGEGFAHDPVHVFFGEYYFWDETWADRFGPFETEEEARENLKVYCETVLADSTFVGDTPDKEIYCLGILFDEDFKHIILIRKNYPEWAAGFWNGVGGHVKWFETPLAAIVRETQEEALVEIPQKEWIHFCNYESEAWLVHVFTAKAKLSELKLNLPRASSEGPVRVVPLNELGKGNYDMLPDLAWVIPMAVGSLIGEEVAWHKRTLARVWYEPIEER
jgi:ADP-ribose pyrophosphatase YjhB (NUDIX family)